MRFASCRGDHAGGASRPASRIGVSSRRGVPGAGAGGEAAALEDVEKLLTGRVL
jgi:hypothetical protein